MKIPRRAYRPETVADLESRLALSHVAAAAPVPHVHRPAERPKESTLTKPEFTLTWSDSDGTTHIQTVKQTASFGNGQFITNVGTQLPGPDTVSIGVPPNAALVTISYQNTSKTAITSAIISDKLNPGLTLEPGSAPSSSSGVVTTTTKADGVQTVQFNIDGGIAANEQGYVQFEVTRNR
jgi:uncharacterized repeat protein (TIGR01451 family)